MKKHAQTGKKRQSADMPPSAAGATESAASAGNSARLESGMASSLLLDKLSERHAFEQTGARLYDALIAKFDAAQDGSTSMTLADLQQIRQDEAQHAALIAEAMAGLGSDPAAPTPSAGLVGIESMGLMQVVTDPRTTVAESLHAVLVAELTDQAGWEILITLAEEAEQYALIAEFSVALEEERAHLTQVQRWYEEALIGKAVSSGALIDDVGDINPSKMH